MGSEERPDLGRYILLKEYVLNQVVQGCQLGLGSWWRCGWTIFGMLVTGKIN